MKKLLLATAAVATAAALLASTAGRSRDRDPKFCAHSFDGLFHQRSWSQYRHYRRRQCR
jgi:hypothetical protein